MRYTGLAILAGVAAMQLGTAVASAEVIDYEGSWFNITYQTGGAVFVSADLAGTNPTATVDFDGGIFGAGDPDPIVITGNWTVSGLEFELLGDVFFGDVTGTIALDGTIEDGLVIPPQPWIASASFTGTVDDTVIDLDYEVVFSESGGGGTALGMINATPIPEPATLALLALSPLALRCRRPSPR